MSNHLISKIRALEEVSRVQRSVCLVSACTTRIPGQLEEEKNVRNGNRLVQVGFAFISSSLWIAGMVIPQSRAFSSLFSVDFCFNEDLR